MTPRGRRSTDSERHSDYEQSRPRPVTPRLELDQLIHVLSPAFLRKEFAKRAAIAERVNAYEGKPRIVR